MLGVTIFGIFLTPVFYVLLRARRAGRAAATGRHEPETAPVTSAAQDSAALQGSRP
jgi:HAE1 family hydrophobic/amphiphilic exporter-1